MSRKNYATALFAAAMSAVLLSGCPPNAMKMLTLTVSPTTSGAIEVDPLRSAYLAGTEVTLTAVPRDGWIFVNWVGMGLNSTANPTTLRIYFDQTITAVFIPKTSTNPTEGETPAEGEDEEAAVKDGSFEKGSNSPNWTSVSSTGMPIICSEATCGIINRVGASDGTYWAWLGNHPDVGSEGATLFQELYIPSSANARLLFDVAVPVAQNPFNFVVMINNNIVWRLTDADAGLYASYQYVSVDITRYANGQRALLAFVYNNIGDVGKETAVFIDNVSISAPPR